MVSPEIGKACNQTPMMMMRIIPVQKVGRLHSTRLVVTTPVSRRECERAPANTPTATPSTTVTRVATPSSSAVFMTAGPSTDVTGAR